MTEVTVQIIPLYAYSITMKARKEEYDYIIISDSIDKIIEGIADVEVRRGESLEKNHKYFRIEDYIVLPGKETDRHKFRLYCVSDDLVYGGWGEGDVYEVMMKGDMPQAVPDISSYEMDNENVLQEIYHGAYVGDVIYKYCQSHQIKKEVVEKFNIEEGENLAKATIFLAELITKEQ
jgi:hypothetical protein